MEFSHHEIRRLEAVTDRAWPAAEAVAHDGWELRASGSGIGRRVNSVATIGRGTLPLAEKVAAAEAFYRSHSLPPTFKLTAASLPPGLDGFLAAAGYRPGIPVLVHTRALPAGPPAHRARLAEHPSNDWLEVNAAAGEHYAGAPALFLDLVARIHQPLTFALMEDEGRAAAVGMAVADGAWVGLLEIGTHPSHRRRGLARQVIAALLAWGGARGAAIAYLQVVSVNEPALALYRGLGFTEAYRYWYRVAPGDPTYPEPPPARR